MSGLSKLKVSWFADIFPEQTFLAVTYTWKRPSGGIDDRYSAELTLNMRSTSVINK